MPRIHRLVDDGEIAERRQRREFRGDGGRIEALEQWLGKGAVPERVEAFSGAAVHRAVRGRPYRLQRDHGAETEPGMLGPQRLQRAPVGQVLMVGGGEHVGETGEPGRV